MWDITLCCDFFFFFYPGCPRKAIIARYRSLSPFVSTSHSPLLCFVLLEVRLLVKLQSIKPEVDRNEWWTVAHDRHDLSAALVRWAWSFTSIRFFDILAVMFCIFPYWHTKLEQWKLLMGNQHDHTVLDKSYCLKWKLHFHEKKSITSTFGSL